MSLNPMFRDYDLNAQAAHSYCYKKTESIGKSFYGKDRDADSLRKKSVSLALSSLFVHSVLSISNIAYRSFKILTFYHFRTDHKSDYPFKAKLLDTGKDLGIILAQPFAIIALEAAAIFAIFFQEQGLKLYFDIENLLYGRPLLTQIVGYHPNEKVDQKLEVQEDHNDDFSTSLPDEGEITSKNQSVGSGLEANVQELPTPSIPIFYPNIISEEQTKDPSFEEKLREIVDQEGSAMSFNARRLASNCTSLLIDHIVRDFNGENFDEWLRLEMQVVQEVSKLPERFFNNEQIYSDISEKLIERLFEQSDVATVKKFYIADRIQTKLLEKIEEALKNLSFDEPASFKHQYLLLLQVMDSLSITPTPESFPIAQQKIADAYWNCFDELFEKIEQSSFDQNLKERIEILPELIKTIKNGENGDEMFVHLLNHKLEARHVPLLLNYFSHEEKIKQAISAFNTAISNINPSIAQFSPHVNAVLDKLPDEEESHFYLQYFLVQVRISMETMALNMYEKFANYEWNWNKKMHCQRRDDIQAAIEKINEKFQLNIEFVEESKIEYDDLVPRLTAIFPQLPLQDISKWCETNDVDSNLSEFEDWLKSQFVDENQFATIDMLYSSYIDSKFSF